MTEKTTATAGEDKVQRLVQRLLRQRVVQELWYRRGRQDGETWAIERASLEELRMLAEEMHEGAAQELGSLNEIDPALYPSVNAKQLLAEWRRTDEAEGERESGEADWRAYLQGWQHACCDLWREAKPSLR